jgi:hypothetical protein
MLALQFNDAGIMGLSADGQQVVAATSAAVADRVQRIRARMISLGIPVAVGTGVFTMLTFAGAFGLARSERVWAPAAWLGAVATIAGLVSVAAAAKVTEDAAKAPTATVVAPAPAAVTPVPSAFFY